MISVKHGVYATSILLLYDVASLGICYTYLFENIKLL